MGGSADLFLKMSEQEYLSIPSDIRERHLSAKIYSQSINDFDELMQDKMYNELYKTYRETKKELEERAYQLREAKRKQK